MCCVFVLLNSHKRNVCSSLLGKQISPDLAKQHCQQIGVCNVYRPDWSPIRSAIITSEKRKWMCAESAYNLFSRLMITDRIGRREVPLEINCKIINFDYERKNKQSRCIMFKELSQLLLK